MADRLIHITPELPPTVGGVADYTALLSRRLVEVTDGAVEPVLVHAGKEPAEVIAVDVPVVDLSGQCSATALADAVRRQAEETSGRAVVLLEYSGYGYAMRGAPLWLARGLQRVCGGDGPPLVTMFHELYATGPPWTSAFWYSFPQKWVVGQLAQRSTAVVANRHDSTEWLRGHTDTAYHRPIFSNVGEPSTPPVWEQRSPYAVVFGGTGKEALYDEHGARLQALLRTLGIRTLVDIGPRPPKPLLSSLKGIEIDVRGLVDREAVSESLREAQLGLLCRNPKALTKSGSLMAYLAHGVPAVIARRHSTQPNPDLKRGTHYLSLADPSQKSAEQTDWSAVGRSGYDWYRENAHSRGAAELFFRLIDAI